MEIDPLYSDWLTVVDDDEFNLMSKLDYWERLDDSSLRRIEGSKVYVVMREAEWSRYEEIRKRIEMECAALDASVHTDQAEAEMKRLLAIEPKPKVVAVVKTTEPKHVETEQELHRRLFIDPPNHPESSRRPPFDLFGDRL
jgi:hypothetical protein